MSKSDDLPIYVSCDICQASKRCGPHLYEGRFVRKWEMWVCNSCCLTEDVPPTYEARVIKVLDEKGVAYQRNKSGCIIIPG